MHATCPLCAAPAPPPFLRRSAVPVHQNLMAADAAAARAAPRGSLAMVVCNACGFVFNSDFASGLLRYGPGYDNAQGHSPRFVAHLDAMAAHLVRRRGVRGLRVIEIGCGQGDFLRRLVAAGNTATGFDPAYDGPARDGTLRFERRLYGPDCGEPADVVICRHVIEHVVEPLALLAAIRAAAPAARVFFETPCVAAILRGRVLWDLFYEHCSLFSARTLRDAFARAGFAVRGVRHVFAGQYLWLEAGPGRDAVRPGAGSLPALARAYGRAEPALLAGWRERLAALAADGRVALWGAGAKGATLTALADPERRHIDCLIDINPAKQGRFVPATAHPILAPAALATRGIRHVVLMNNAYRAEVARRLPADARLVGWAA